MGTLRCVTQITQFSRSLNHLWILLKISLCSCWGAKTTFSSYHQTRLSLCWATPDVCMFVQHVSHAITWTGALSWHFSDENLCLCYTDVFLKTIVRCLIKPWNATVKWKSVQSLLMYWLISSWIGRLLWNIKVSQYEMYFSSTQR